jgi:ubiquinone/menaquinone biosynthesis C-methylase UbiE
VTTPRHARPGFFSRLKTLLVPRTSFCSALDPDAQSDLDELNRSLAAFYNSPVVTQYFSTADTINAEWSSAFAPHLHLRASIPVGSDVLDIGCGSAHPARHLHDRLRSYTGVDWSAAQIAENRKRFPAHTFIASSLYDVPLPPASADVVMSLYVVEHCVWPHRLLEEMFRLARPGGLIAVLTPPFRQKSYLKSLDYGLSARPFADKLRSGDVLDVLWHLYHHRVWYPLFLRRYHPRGNAQHRFLIHRHPVALTSSTWFPDADAVHMSDTAEMLAHLQERGTVPVAHWPKWGYLLVRKPA